MRPKPIRLFPMLLLVLIVGACMPAKPPEKQFNASVNTGLMPPEPLSLDARGNPRPVAASVDDQNIETDLVETFVLIRPKSDADLQNFLTRYDGVVISDDTIPQPPRSLGMTLTDDQRKPTEYVVQINTAKANLDALSDNAAAAGLSGTMQFSTQAALETFAAVGDA